MDRSKTFYENRTILILDKLVSSIVIHAELKWQLITRFRWSASVTKTADCLVDI